MNTPSGQFFFMLANFNLACAIQCSADTAAGRPGHANYLAIFEINVSQGICISHAISFRCWEGYQGFVTDIKVLERMYMCWDGY